MLGAPSHDILTLMLCIVIIIFFFLVECTTIISRKAKFINILSMSEMLTNQMKDRLFRLVIDLIKPVNNQNLMTIRGATP